MRPGAELTHPPQRSEPHCLCRNITRIHYFFTKNADRIFKILPISWLIEATFMPWALQSLPGLALTQEKLCLGLSLAAVQ